MICKLCNGEFKDVLKHLKKSVTCQDEEYIEEIVQSRRSERLAKKRERSKDYYERNKEAVSEVRAEHYTLNKDCIRKNQAKYYEKGKNIVAQRQRFAKHFGHNDAMKYLTTEQIHLFEHCNSVCQPESMRTFNHSVEYYDGLCKFCSELQGIKLFGVNRQVCVKCQKAQCTICEIEVSPDPECGCFHYSPDMGSLLKFMPEYCPLYSKSPKIVSNQLVIHDCKICLTIKKDYPEYEIFGEKTSQFRTVEWLECRKIDIYLYTCNLCGSTFDHVCEFDLHLRAHTKYGKNVAIVNIGSSYQVNASIESRLEGEDFQILEAELLKIPGLSSVLSVFSKQRLQYFCSDMAVGELNLFASLHLKEGTNLEEELATVSFDAKVIENIKILCVKNHFITDTSTESMYELSHYKRRNFDKLLRWKDEPLLNGYGIAADDSWYRRNTALLSSRCSLQFPVDHYQAIPLEDVVNFSRHVRKFLWNRVKNSDLCCCVSKFFCNSSINIDKCKIGCCKKCPEISGGSRENVDSNSSLDNE